MSRIEEIKKRLEAATPGPWKADNLGQYIFAGEMMLAQTRGWGYLTSPNCLNLTEDEAIDVQIKNAEFIAHAPEDMQFLVDDLEAANAKIAELEEENRELKNQVQQEHWNNLTDADRYDSIRKNMY